MHSGFKVQSSGFGVQGLRLGSNEKLVEDINLVNGALLVAGRQAKATLNFEP